LGRPGNQRQQRLLLLNIGSFDSTNTLVKEIITNRSQY
jgi:hypothetical protein